MAKNRNLKYVTDHLEKYIDTKGLVFWKTKEVSLNFENILQSVFILSIDLAQYLGIKHLHLMERNIFRLQKEKLLPAKLPKFVYEVEIGKTAKRDHVTHAFTRHQTEIVIMDIAGTKARKKKFEILLRLHAIEREVLQGNYSQAKQKAQNWDGVDLLKEFGFSSSFKDLATKKDIAHFLDISEGTLNSFLHKHQQQITPIKLDRAKIASIGGKARRLNAYKWEDVFKICFWMDTPVGGELKQKILGQLGVSLKSETREETQWRKIFCEIFAGLNPKFNYNLDGKYRVDCLVFGLDLVLECDQNNHKYYDKSKEQERDRFITERYTLIRFNSKIRLQTLINAILKAKPGELIKLYI